MDFRLKLFLRETAIPRREKLLPACVFLSLHTIFLNMARRDYEREYGYVNTGTGALTPVIAIRQFA